ncbi:MAG: endonuclease MutS2, partial [Candidatus Zixiibacteriota bacterium]
MTEQISPHTLEALEYPKIVARIAGRCLTPYGREHVAQLRPLFDKAVIDRRQDEAAQMQDIVRFGLPFPLTRIDDCREALKRSTVEGEILEPAEINRVLELVTLSISLHRYNTEERDKFPAIAEYLQKLRAFPELQKEIRRCIDDQGEIKDSASPALKRIRREQVDLRRHILRRLEQIVGSQRKQAGWQDDIVTQRNGRYVISVLSSQYQSSMGILHDRSQSGNTLFVEPQETVELNNRLNMLQQEEHVEIVRILKTLTGEIGQRASALTENCRLIGLLDARHATAELAVALKATRPVIHDTPGVELEQARHPLLILQAGNVEKVVPLSLTLDADRRGIVITGPNTGGKTVALKTIGLLVLMAQSGLPIPAKEKSAVGIFRNVFADIGDEQSIEQSLSTFSSHMGHIVEAVDRADEHTLVLFDEIGAGTDPKEGAALAEAIIIHLVERGVYLVATTHYSQLKTLPLSHPELENASLEFDRDNLSPT